MSKASSELQRLEREVKELSHLCRELDPFSPIDQKFQRKLKKWGLADEEDPFVLTNKLIKGLEDAITALEKRKIH